MRKLVGSTLVSLAATAIAAVLLAPAAAATPASDADDAITAAWEKAGGDTSTLGAKVGDVYPVGDGFGQDFDGGKMFYTEGTGAHFLYGPILEKYESLGGPGGSDLGFPTINEVRGLAGPDSRVSTFSASDNPVIYWTLAHGAFVVRGAINAAWDKLGSSGGVLGVPVSEETYDGEVSSQKFSGGQVSWNRQTKQFTTDPPVLADQLKGLQVPIDPTAAINMAWRAAGGANGPLGAKQGEQHPIGGDGIVQDFAGGKVYFSPATGANAVESDILAKYESLGGPTGSGLGFPIANESDGGIPSSRICTFSAADEPVIFWTAEHGAFVVRGAMKAAWDKLRGPVGKLGAPVGDQAVDGDVVSQQFTGGKISWNRTKNTFTTEPPNLAPLLSGLQVSGQHQPSNAAMPPQAKKFTWHWWWLLAAIPVLILIVLSVLVAFGWRRRRADQEDAAYEPDLDVGYDAEVDRHWGEGDGDVATEHFGVGDLHRPADTGQAGRVAWTRGGTAPYGDEELAESGEGARHFEGPLGMEEEDPDAVDTDSIPVISEADLVEAGYPAAEVDRPDTADETGYPEADHPDDDYADIGYPDVAVPHTPPDTALVGGTPDAAAPEAGYSDVADGHAPADAGSSEAAAPDTQLSGTGVAGAVAAAAEPRPGRHAAVDAGDTPESGVASPAPRPTIHLPLDDPYQMPDGFPIKASARFGLYYTPESELYHDTLAELWLSTEEVAQANGFVKAD